MKILVPTFRSDTGNDVYFRGLKDGLNRRHISIEIRPLMKYLEFTPRLARATLRRGSQVSDCSVVHTNADYGTVFRAASKPFVVTAHHDVFDPPYQNCSNFAQKAYHYGLLKSRITQALNNADRIVAVSYSTRASLERTFGMTKIDVIHNGVDTDVFRPRQVPGPIGFGDKIKLLFVGNLTKRKGADLLPRIMERLGNKYTLFYTGTPRSGMISRQSNTVSLGRVSREKLTDIYNMSDIFLFPSRLEGFGYAVAEAMACGRPVVCTDCSSLPELVVDQKGGHLCRRDDVEDFVEKVRALGDSPGLRASMGQYNRNRIVESFTLDKMADSYLQLYRGVLRAD